MRENHTSTRSGLFLGLGLLVLGLFFSHGLYQAYWLWTLPAAAIAVFYSAFSFRLPTQLYRFLPAALFIIGAVFINRGFGQLGNLQAAEPDREWLITGMRLCYFTASIFSVYCLGRSKRASLYFSFSVLFLSLGLTFLLSASPRPWIDVWTVQEAATAALLNGKNPYAIEYLNIYPRGLQPLLNPFGNPFVYLPGVLYILTPLKWLGLDIRVALILTNAATAFLIASLRKKQNFFAALLFLSFPFVPYLIDQAWNDCLTVFFIALAAFSLERKSWPWFLTALAGMSLIKQHIFMVLPILLYFGSRHLHRSVVKTTLIWMALFSAGCLPFAIWDWPNFVGSLWGLHAFTHPTGPILPDRLDGFSLLNWLSQNTGLRPYSVFALVGLFFVFYAYRAKAKIQNLSSLFSYCAVAMLLVFATAPLAFLNYYWVCIGFLVCAVSFNQNNSSVFTPWPDDVILFTMSRCLLLFSTQFFQSQTTFYNFFAAEKLTTLVPLQNFGYRLLPLSQLPMSAAGALNLLANATPLLSYRLFFIGISLAADTLFFFVIRKRCTRANLMFYITASSLLFDQFYDHVELWAGLAIALGWIYFRRSRFFITLITFALQWTAGILLALSDLFIQKGRTRFAGAIAVGTVIFVIMAFSNVPVLQYFFGSATDENPASIWAFIKLPASAAVGFVLVATAASAAAVYREKRPAYLMLFSVLVFDPLAGTGALVLLLPCLALTAPINRTHFSIGFLLLISCALRTLEFHGLLPIWGASQCALTMTYVAACLTANPPAASASLRNFSDKVPNA